MAADVTVKARQICSDQEAGMRGDAGNHVVHHSVEQVRDSKE
jgi:hypothetical protein